MSPYFMGGDIINHTWKFKFCPRVRDKYDVLKGIFLVIFRVQLGRVKIYCVWLINNKLQIAVMLYDNKWYNVLSKELNNTCMLPIFFKHE